MCLAWIAPEGMLVSLYVVDKIEQRSVMRGGMADTGWGVREGRWHTH